MAGFVANTERAPLSGEGPESVVLVVSGAYTATANAEFGAPRTCRAIEVSIVATAAAATPSVVFGVEGYNPASDSWELLLASAAVVGTGTTVLIINPDAAPVANVVAQRLPRRRMRLVATHADADALTYSVAVHSA